ncbi:phage-shock protein [Alishewanella longhuensis]
MRSTLPLGWYWKKSLKAAKHLAAGSGAAAYADRPVELKTRVWQRGESPKQALQHLNHQFNSMELKLRDMERHVTSNRFQLNREFNNL